MCGREGFDPRYLDHRPLSWLGRNGKTPPLVPSYTRYNCVTHMPRTLNTLLFVGLLLCAITSCTPRTLDIQTRQVDHERLASFQVGTPDPKLNTPLLGEELLIQWFLCKRDVCTPPVPTLHLTVRLRNHEEEHLCVPLTKRRGTFVYQLLNERFAETKGVQTYDATIQKGDTLLAEWKHPLWAEWISLSKKP